MDLMPASIAKHIPKLHTIESIPPEQRIAYLKIFDCCGRFTAYVTEYDGKDTMFGFVFSPLGPDCDEWGYLSLSELKGVKNRLGLGMERDIHWESGPIPFHRP